MGRAATMDRLFDTIRNGILNFKLNLCCFIFSVRVGILLFATYNLITSVLALIAVMTSSFPSLYMHTQQIIMEGEYVKSSGAFAYCAEICSNVLLLCGVFRKDVTLLRYFTRVGLAMAAGTLLVYAMVIGVLDVLSTLVFFISLTCQIYVVLLVRSYIVDLQAEGKTNYLATWRRSYVETIYRKPEEKYTIVIDPEPSHYADVVIAEPEELSAREIIEIIEANEPKVEMVDTNTPTKDQTNKPNNTKNEVKDTTKEERDTSSEEKDTTSEVKVMPREVNVTQSELKDVPEASTSINTPASKSLRYPYRFVAIKIPKEKTIQEEGSNEEIKKENGEKSENKQSEDKELNKDEIKEEAKEVANLSKLTIRSIFGRRKKKKDSEPKTNESKKS